MITKYRAWHPVLKTMFYNVRVSSKDWTDESEHYGGNHETLSQYTGQDDKNNTEIYRGDVLRLDKPLEYETDVLFVQWDDRFSSWCLTKKGWMFNHFFGEAVEASETTVIGNIWENPELIKPAPEKAG